MTNLDTRSKRASSAQVLQPFGLALPAPDGTIGQADRQHIVWVYSGIISTVIAIKAFVAGARTLAFSAEGRTLSFTADERETDFTVEAR